MHCFLNGSRGNVNTTVLQSCVRSVSVHDAHVFHPRSFGSFDARLFLNSWFCFCFVAFIGKASQCVDSEA